MENKTAASFKRSYSDFEPFCKWRKDDGREILEIHLQDFKKENLRVQINHRGILTISGEQPSWGDKWSRFRKEFEVSDDCDFEQIKAKLSAGVLTITMPKRYPPPAEKPPSVQVPKPQEHRELKQRKDKKKEADDSKGRDGERDENGKTGPRLLWRLKLSRRNFVKFAGLLLVMLVTFGTYIAYRKIRNKDVKV